MSSAAPHPSGNDDTRDGLRLLRRYHEGTLQYHERRAEVRFVIDGRTGDLILPTDPGFGGELGGSEVVLHLPDEIHRDLQLSATVEVIPRPESEESVDRWNAYHAASGGGARPTPAPGSAAALTAPRPRTLSARCIPASR